MQLEQLPKAGKLEELYHIQAYEIDLSKKLAW